MSDSFERAVLNDYFLEHGYQSQGYFQARVGLQITGKYAHADADAYTSADTIAHADADAFADTIADAGADADADAYTSADEETGADTDALAYTC